MARDLRRHERVPADCFAQINWKDRYGNEAFANAKVLNVSESGLRVQVPGSMEVGSRVTFRVDKLALHGTGSVRTCTREGPKYSVGIQFSGGLKWRPKPPKPAGPAAPLS
jgi:PilZ domain-containing protein